MTGCRDMDEKHKKCPKNRVFSPIFFKNWALPLLYPYGALTSCKKLEKPNEQSLRYLKADHGPQTTDGQISAITKDPLG